MENQTLSKSEVLMTPRGNILKRPGPPGGVRDTNRVKKSQAIRDAALGLFLDRGVEGVSVDDIMKAAQMAKGSFYRYFSDQAALMEELMAPLRARMAEALEVCATELADNPSRDAQTAVFQRIAAILGGLMTEFPGEVRLYLQECRAPGVGARRPIVELAKRVTNTAIDITARAQQSGLAKSGNPAVAALTVVGAVERLLLALLLKEDVGDDAAVPPVLVDTLLEGLRSPLSRNAA
jgi:AcrR family transcriptional regulator